MIHFVLNDLGGKALEILDSGLEIDGLVLHPDLFVAFGFPGTTQKRQAPLLGFIGSFGFQDDRVEHNHVLRPRKEGNDAPPNTDHVPRHAHTFLPVGFQGFQQVACGGNILLGGFGGGHG